MQKANALLSKANPDELPKRIFFDLRSNAGRTLESGYKTPNSYK
jgi:hypothetical protein